MNEFNFEFKAPKTDDVESCKNLGCGFNLNGKCTASGTECFGYIEDEGE